MNKILLSTLVITSLLIAEEPTNELITHTELGYIETDGNTDTQTFNIDSKAEKSINNHMFTLSLDAQYATNDGNETKNKYVAEANYDYSFTKRLSFGYLLGYKDDKFSGFDYQLYTGPTLKYVAIKSETQKLKVGANVLYTEDKYENLNEANEYAAYGLSLVYGWEISKTLKFAQDLGYRAEIDDGENYFAFSKTGFTSKVSDIFSAGVSYKIDYINLPALGKEYADKTLTANLIIDY